MAPVLDARDVSPPDQGEPPDAPDADEDAGGGDTGDAEPADGGDAEDAEVDVPVQSTLDNGRPCSRADQCTSGVCTQGICCDSACDGICESCKLASAVGTCLPVPAGEDPEQQCAADLPGSCGKEGNCDGYGACRLYPAGTECVPGGCTAGVESSSRTCDGAGTCRAGMTNACPSGLCTGSSCAAPCTQHAQCQTGFFCEAGRCALKKANAAICSSTAECQSGFCADGVCCNTRCTDRCNACNLAGKAGTCSPAAAGQDPRGECIAEAATTCGRAGGCNGNGVCRLHPANTICAPTTCSSALEEASARTCDGAGVCRPAAAPRNCGAYICSPASCATGCTDSSSCQPGFSCQSSACARIPGLVLLWRFEETSGTAAIDSSGNGRNGVYRGDSGTPISSVSVPPSSFSNTRSRAFTQSSRHGVQLAVPPAALRPTNDFTVMAWYSARSTDYNGSDIVSAGNGFTIRLRPSSVEFAKRTGSGHVHCPGSSPGFLDGRWHHLAGVASRSFGLKVYYDGNEVGSASGAADVVYSSTAVTEPGTGLWVGRHGDDQAGWVFGGNVDEVRIYSRVLSAAEIKSIAEGRNN